MDNYNNIINQFYSRIYKSKNLNEKLLLIKELYKYVKEISPRFYVNGKMMNEYKEIKSGIIKCESLISKKPIIQFKRGNYSPSNNLHQELCNIVSVNMSYLEHHFNINDLTNICETSCNNIQDICSEKGIRSKQIIIYPGFSKYAKLFNGDGFHFANIVTIDNKDYLIDCTYSQFFFIQKNILERVGIVGLRGCHAGIFMKLDEKRKRVAEELLTKGWIELTDENAKAYFDGFAISFRNGLYYELNKDYSFQTNYTAEDYYNFLNGYDNQINHETELVLGFQKVPLGILK